MSTPNRVFVKESVVFPGLAELELAITDWSLARNVLRSWTRTQSRVATSTV